VESVLSVPVLHLDDLHVDLAGRRVLNGLSLRTTGGALGLLGPNGAGKSTLIRTLLGFHRPVSGSAHVIGFDAAREARKVRSAIGYMPENDSFIAGMSAVRFVRYMGELHGLPPADAMERAHEALFWAGLGEARYRNVETFSTGMKQRVKLAQAIVHGPQLVFLDEPTNGLDPPGRKHMVELIQELSQSRHLNVLISSHLLPDVEACADEVMILKEGHVVRVHDLRAERESAYRFVELDVVGDLAPFNAELDRLGVEHVPTIRGRVRAILPPELAVRDLFAASQAAGVVLRSMKQRRDTLEDVFLEAMGERPLAPTTKQEAGHGGA
jgi:ABC-2 type transport system ATP-binding protein